MLALPDPDVRLTQEESDWLAAHPVVQVGVLSTNHFPVEAWVAGNPEGIGVDYIKLLASRAGLRLQFRPFSNYEEVSFGDNKIDLPYEVLVGQPFGASKRFDYLPIYAESPFVMVSPKGDLKIRKEADLERARIVIERIGNPYTAVIKHRFPNATLVFSDDARQALDMVAQGQVDAYIGGSAHTRWMLAEREHDDLSVISKISDLRNIELSAAVVKGQPILTSILKKAAASLKESDLTILRTRWGYGDDISTPIARGRNLSDADRAWLRSVGTLRVGYEIDRYPYSFMAKNGTMDGLSNDYLSILKKELGLRLEFVPARDLDELQRRVSANEVDVVAAAMPADFGTSEMTFTRPYERFPVVIVARIHGLAIAGPEDLRGKKVAVRQEAGLVAGLRMLLPRTTLVPVSSNEAGLSALEKGDVAAYIGTLPAIDALIRDRYAATLRVVAPAGMDQDFSFGVSRDLTQLSILMDQVIASMKDGDRQAIRSHWLRTDYSYGAPWHWVVIGLLIAGVVVTFIGIAYKRMRDAEGRARASEQRLVDTNENLPGVVVRFRVGDDKALHYEYVGGPTMKIFGLASQDMLSGKASPFDNVVEEDLVRADEALSHAIREGRSEATELRTRIDGNVRWVRVVGGEPKPTGQGDHFWSVYCADVTAEKEQERALQEAKATAEAAVAAKGSFLAMMSHEIRTPMAGVVGLVELLSKTPLSNEQAHMLGMAQDSAVALLQILDDILDFSRLEAVDLELEPASFDLRQLADSAIGTFAARAQQKSLKLYLVADWRLAAEYLGDANRIRQIINNLLSNALKFTEQGYVKLRIEMAGEEHGRQRLRFLVMDTGIGISSDQLKRLFQPFMQAEASTTRRFGGTGLGLSICRRLAIAMGGDVQLYGLEEGGAQAVFEVELPVARPAAGLPEFSARRVLVCTTDARLERELANALSAMGFSVIEVDADDLMELSAGDADLLIAEAPLLERLAPLPTMPVIRVLADPDPRGYYVENGSIMLCGCPLLWRATVDACRLALGVPLPADGQGESPVDRARSGHILVAEDHPINRAVISRQLDLLGYPHTVVEDGQQAWEALQKQRFDLLISDCHMPILDGYELARRIRDVESHGSSHLPIVALSASALPEQVEKCRAAGMDDFLAKPVQLKELEAKILQFFNKEDAVPISTPTKDDDRLDYLSKMFGSEEQLKQLLEGLILTGREDVIKLDEAMARGDIHQQHEMMHRLVGSLRLIGLHLVDTHSADSMAAHRDEVVAQLGGLSKLMDRLNHKL